MECSEKKYRFQPEVVRSYIKKVMLLERISTEERMYSFHGLHFEALIGDKKGLYSIRLNYQYRLEFKITTEEAEGCVLTICSLTDITNHYK